MGNAVPETAAVDKLIGRWCVRPTFSPVDVTEAGWRIPCFRSIRPGRAALSTSSLNTHLLKIYRDSPRCGRLAAEDTRLQGRFQHSQLTEELSLQ
jgi:hypothetical protein